MYNHLNHVTITTDTKRDKSLFLCSLCLYFAFYQWVCAVFLCISVSNDRLCVLVKYWLSLPSCGRQYKNCYIKPGLFVHAWMILRRHSPRGPQRLASGGKMCQVGWRWYLAIHLMLINHIFHTFCWCQKAVCIDFPRSTVNGQGPNWVSNVTHLAFTRA